jgi:hypothetical protein
MTTESISLCAPMENLNAVLGIGIGDSRSKGATCTVILAQAHLSDDILDIVRGISVCHSRDHKQHGEQKDRSHTFIASGANPESEVAQLELNKPRPHAVLNNC